VRSFPLCCLDQCSTKIGLPPLTALEPNSGTILTHDGHYQSQTVSGSGAQDDGQGLSPIPPIGAAAESPAAGHRRLRAVKACNKCRRDKTRCSGSTPCGRCQRLKRDCLYDPAKSRRQLNGTTEGVGPYWMLQDTICDSCTTLGACEDYKPCRHCLREKHDCRIQGVLVEEMAMAKIRQIEMSEAASRQASGSYLGSEIQFEQGHRSDQGSGWRPVLPSLKPNTIGTPLSTSQSRDFSQQNPLGGFGGTVTDERNASFHSRALPGASTYGVPIPGTYTSQYPASQGPSRNMSDIFGIRPNVQTFAPTDQGQYFARDLHPQSQIEGAGHYPSNQSYHLPPPAPSAIPQG
jgi:hypothetical protein